MSTVRGEVARRESEPNNKPDLAIAVRKAIELQRDSLATVLPTGKDADRFSRILISAVKANPKLMECFGTDQGRTSVLLCAMQLATVGLEPNTPTQQAWLEPRRNKGVMECRVAYGYRGLLELARRSGEIKSVVCEVVHEADHFVFVRGAADDKFEHEYGPGDRGALTHAYAILRYQTGGYDIVVLGRDVIEKQHRARSDGFKNNPALSPWTNDTAAMWRKTALRECLKYAPTSTQLVAAIAAEDRPLSLDDGVIVVAATYDDEPTPELVAAQP
jgi:recombination protein RecT